MTHFSWWKKAVVGGKISKHLPSFMKASVSFVYSFIFLFIY